VAVARECLISSVLNRLRDLYEDLCKKALTCEIIGTDLGNFLVSAQEAGLFHQLVRSGTAEEEAESWPRSPMELFHAISALTDGLRRGNPVTPRFLLQNCDGIMDLKGMGCWVWMIPNRYRGELARRAAFLAI
jgi:hypothetical protein